VPGFAVFTLSSSAIVYSLYFNINISDSKKGRTEILPFVLFFNPIQEMMHP
jgi:hypothetical protein